MCAEGRKRVCWTFVWPQPVLFALSFVLLFVSWPFCSLQDFLVAGICSEAADPLNWGALQMAGLHLPAHRGAAVQWHSPFA